MTIQWVKDTYGTNMSQQLHVKRWTKRAYSKLLSRMRRASGWLTYAAIEIRKYSIEYERITQGTWPSIPWQISWQMYTKMFLSYQTQTEDRTVFSQLVHKNHTHSQQWSIYFSTYSKYTQTDSSSLYPHVPDNRF